MAADPRFALQYARLDSHTQLRVRFTLPVKLDANSTSRLAYNSPLIITPAGVSPDSLAGLALWLKADALVGLNDGDPVTSWPDSSGNAHATTVPSTAPVYRASAINGLPAVDFNAPSPYPGMRSDCTLGDTATIFVVAVCDVSTPGHARAVQGFGSNLVLGPYDGTWSLYLNGFITGSSMVNGFAVPMAMALDSTGVTFYDNGMTRGSHVTTATLNQVSLGAGGQYNEWFPGRIAEVIAYNVRLAEADIQNVINYLATKYGTAATDKALRFDSEDPNAVLLDVDEADLNVSVPLEVTKPIVDDSGNYTLTSPGNSVMVTPATRGAGPVVASTNAPVSVSSKRGPRNYRNVTKTAVETTDAAKPTPHDNFNQGFN